MAITSSTRFESVRLTYYGLDDEWSLSWNDSNGFGGSITIWVNGNVRYDSDSDDLAAMRAIYASDAGFQDADGNPVTVSLRDFFYGDGTLASIEANGFINPLDTDSIARGGRKREFDSAVLTELASVNEDSTTERPDAAIRFGVVPTRRQPTVLLHSLDQWWCQSNNSTSWNFVVDFVVADAITTDNVGERVDVQAMLLWLESVRASGDEVNTAAVTHLDIAAAVARGRTYSFDQAAGQTVIATCVGVTYSTLRYSISFIQTSESATHDPALIDTFLEGTSVNLTPTGEAEEPPFGAYDVAAQASAVEFDANHRLSMVGGRLVLRGHDSGGNIYRVDLGGSGRTVRFNDLDAYDTSAKKLPRGFAQNVVHFGPDQTANGTLRIESPPDVIPIPGGEYEFTVHNRDETYGLDIDDWTGSDICTLHPGERITLRMTRRTDGSGELVDAVPFERRLHISGSNYGFMNSNNGWYWRHTEGAKWARCIRMPEDSHQYSQRTYHADAFDVGTLTYQAVTDPAVYESSNINTIHSVDIGRAGYLRCEFIAGMYLDGEGTVPQGNGLRIALQNGNVNTELRTVGQPTLVAPEPMVLSAAFERPAAVGDIIAPLWFYPETISVPMASIRNTTYHLEMTLTQTIELEYTPS